MLALLVVHAALTVAVAASRRLGRGALALAALAPATAAAWALVVGATADAPPREVVAWVPALGLDLALRADDFGILMTGLVGVVGVLVLGWAAQTTPPADARRLGALLVAFLGGMVGIVLADGVLTLFVFWEVTTVTSFLLIGFRTASHEAQRSARQALAVTGLGGLALLAGLLVVAQAAGTTSLAAIVADPPTGAVVEVGLALILLGAITKSAQVPFHGWLAGAMVAPTPVSALLHSATMVKAGIVVVARLSPAFAPVAWWTPALLAIGVATFVWGGWRAWRSDDAKALLAGTTVATLGLLVAVYGVGSPKAMLAGTALLVAHAVYKAGLFLAVGTIEKLVGTRDLRRLPDLRPHVRWLVAAVGVLGASMGGLPPLLAYAAKEAGLVAIIDVGTPLVLIGIGAGTAVGLAAAIRLVAAVVRPPRLEVDAPLGEVVLARRTAFGLGAGPVSLAAASVVLGLATPLATTLVVPAARALGGADAATYSLTLWAGFDLALAVSAAGLVGGALLAAFGAASRRWPQRGSWSAATAAVLDGLGAVASRTAATVERLPAWAHVLPVIGSAIALVGIRLVLGRPALTATGGPTSDGFPLTQTLAVAGVVAAVAGILVVRERFAAVVLLGAVGYLLATLFLLSGAPDLAMTQVLVETVAVAAFVLVLRRLPRRGRRMGPGAGARRRAGVRALVAAATGTAAGGALLAATSSAGPRPVAEAAIERAVPDAAGSNVVNVILTDFRALDTVGEVAVLATAAIGVVALIARRGRHDP